MIAKTSVPVQPLCGFFSLEFYGIEVWLLKKAISALASQGKAELIAGSSSDDSNIGVKFFG